MSKRNYDDTRDGAPEEDDARYASLHYRYGPGYSAMPPITSSSTSPGSTSAFPGSGSGLAPSGSRSYSAAYEQHPHLPPIRRGGNYDNDDNANLLGPPVAFAGYSVTPTPPLAVDVGVVPSSASASDASAAAVVPYGASIPGPAPPPLSISASATHPHPHTHHHHEEDNREDDDGPGPALPPSQFSIPPPAALGPATDLLEVAPGVFRNRTHPWESAESCAYAIDEDMYHMLFQTVHGRQLNTLQPLYQLPVDEDEIKVRYLAAVIYSF